MKTKVYRKISGIFVLAVTLFMSGCATNLFPGGPSPAGVIITNVKAPAQNLTVATDSSSKHSKIGTSSVTSVAGLFAFGDAGIDAAMKDAGITKVHHIDHQINAILLGLYVKHTTIVYGE